MFYGFFGVPQKVIRSRIWARMKPTEQSLYICLLHESERYCTRELSRTDAQMRELTELSSRSFCTARKKLQERGLCLCRRSVGNAYIYTLCDPETGQPWPGNPKVRMPYVKKADRSAVSETVPVANRGDSASDKTSPKADPEPAAAAETHGIHLKF